MNSFFKSSLSEKQIGVLELLLIVVTSCIPLLFTYPYRINLFLAWEGAYRMANGEIPYRDFGSPVGYGFWLLPALFFKIFGSYVYTLIVVQAFINTIVGYVFRALLKLFDVSAAPRFLALLVFCISYSMFNFWPWYNHFVFVVESIAIYFLCAEVLKAPDTRKVWRIVLSSFFTAFAFMTKQDTGALAFFIAVAILGFDFIVEKKWKTIMLYFSFYALSMAVLILPFLPYEFSYWFNMGQYPHNARTDKFDLLNEFLGASSFIKLYLVIITVLFIGRMRDVGDWRKNKSYVLFGLIVLCILGQAAIIQVTSYIPLDGNIYFHSFAVGFILFHFERNNLFSRLSHFIVFVFLVCLWWSGVFWTRFLKEKVQHVIASHNGSEKNKISKNTYLLEGDTTNYSRSKWVVPNLKTFKRIKVPQGTADGIEMIKALPESKKENLQVLNMSELTPLAYDMNYVLERGANYPLWFHKGVAFFDREVDLFCGKIQNKQYDIILFEDIPNVNQFYSYEVRECIRQNYVLKFKFVAPRIPEISTIEVYTRQ